MIRGGKGLTDEQKAKIVRLKQQGIEPQYIAQRFGISRNTVNNIYSEYNRNQKGIK